MILQDKVEFAKLMLITADKYKRDFSKGFVEMYWVALKKFSFHEVKNAFASHFNNPDNGHFLPQQSDILRILEGDSEMQALDAWTKVMKAIKHKGSYSSIVFDDFIIHAVIADMDGWIGLCQLNQEELKFKGYEFHKRYRGCWLKRPEYYPNRLIGIIEHQNSIQGFSLPEPIYFGNQQAARLTFAEGVEPHAYRLADYSMACQLALKQTSKTNTETKPLVPINNQ